MIHHTVGCDRRGLGGSARTSDAPLVSWANHVPGCASGVRADPLQGRRQTTRSGASRSGSPDPAANPVQAAAAAVTAFGGASTEPRWSQGFGEPNGSRASAGDESRSARAGPARRWRRPRADRPLCRAIGTRRRDPDSTGSNTLRRLVRRDIGCCRVTFTAVVNSESRLGFSTPI